MPLSAESACRLSEMCRRTNKYVESLIFQYNDFESLYIDWLYCFECIKKEEFDFHKNNAVRAYSKDCIQLELKENEKDALLVERDGVFYLQIRTDPNEGPVAFMNHIPYTNLENNLE